MPTLEFADTDLAYLAALIDGEGCLTPHVQRRSGGDDTYSSRIVIRMTDREPIEWCSRTFGGTFRLEDKADGYKQQYAWTVQRQADVASLLSASLPWFRGKRAQVVAAVELAEHVSAGLPHNNRAQGEKADENNAWRDERRRRSDRLRVARDAVNVLALDPGERVGWARASVLPTGEWLDLKHGITPLWDMATACYTSAYKYDVVVMEDWRLYPHMANNFVGSAFPSVQFIGAVRLCCKLSGTKLVMQGAAVKKTADKTLAKLRPELHELVTRPIKHDDGHDQDAIRHLWVYTFRNTDVTTLIKGAA